jgi:hypothetical protein
MQNAPPEGEDVIDEELDKEIEETISLSEPKKNKKPKNIKPRANRNLKKQVAEMSAELKKRLEE